MRTLGACKTRQEYDAYRKTGLCGAMGTKHASSLMLSLHDTRIVNRNRGGLLGFVVLLLCFRCEKMRAQGEHIPQVGLHESCVPADHSPSVVLGMHGALYKMCRREQVMSGGHEEEGARVLRARKRRQRANRIVCCCEAAHVRCDTRMWFTGERKRAGTSFLIGCGRQHAAVHARHLDCNALQIDWRKQPLSN